MSFSSSTLPTGSDASPEDDPHIVLDPAAFWWICYWIAVFSGIFGAILMHWVDKRRMKHGKMILVTDDSSQTQSLEPSQGGNREPPDASKLLGPEDDRLLSIGHVQLKLLCTRRQLLEAYNKPGVYLVTKPVAKTWVMNKLAKDHLPGFELGAFTLRNEAPNRANQVSW